MEQHHKKIVVDPTVGVWNHTRDLLQKDNAQISDQIQEEIIDQNQEISKWSSITKKIVVDPTVWAWNHTRDLLQKDNAQISDQIQEEIIDQNQEISKWSSITKKIVFDPTVWVWNHTRDLLQKENAQISDQNQEDSRWRNFTGKVVDTTAGVGTTWTVLVGAKCLAGYSIPTLMSSTGTVISGVGTMHSATTAVVASFAATPVGWTALAAGGVVGLWQRPKQ